MSNSVSFEFHTDLDSQYLLKDIRKIWKSEDMDAEVYPGIKTSSLTCVLSYYYGHPDQQAKILDVANYLFSITSDGKLFYYRCNDTINECIDFPFPITLDDIFTDDFEPGMYNGIQYRYLIRKPDNLK